MRIIIKNTTNELNKSLLYTLERKFPKVEFNIIYINNRTFELVTSGEMDQGSEISAIVESFQKKTEFIGARLCERIFWKNDGINIKGLSNEEIETDVAVFTDLPGVYSGGKLLSKWIETLDDICKTFALCNSGIPIEIPSLISQDNLQKAGYWNREEQQICEVNPRLSKHSNQCCLSPAACLPLYPVLASTPNIKPTIYTARTRVYRWEGGVFSSREPLSRLWEYNVREIVYHLKSDEINDHRSRYIKFTKWLMEKLQLKSSLQVATDCFFHSESMNLALYQLMNESKLELKVHFNENELAVSSFNTHKKHFIDAFKIDSNDDLQTACVGFGLERLAYSCVALECSGGGISLENASELIYQVKSFEN